MSCNPAIGGVAKGQIVREIDALGGAMGVLTDATAIQFRLLNRGKGPAMHSPRAQCDKKAYQFLAKLTVERQENLTLRQEMVESIEVEAGRVAGRALPGRGPLSGPGRRADHGHVPPGPDAHRRGQDARRARRATSRPTGSPAAFAALGLRAPAVQDRHAPAAQRPDHRLRRLEPQPGDAEPVPFSFLTDRIDQPQLDCHITDTNPAVHEMIRANLHRAPMYSGQIQSTGPAVLPVDRGQGRPVRRPRQPPDLPRARGAEHPGILLQRHLDQPARATSRRRSSR